MGKLINTAKTIGHSFREVNYLLKDTNSFHVGGGIFAIGATIGALDGVVRKGLTGKKLLMKSAATGGVAAGFFGSVGSSYFALMGLLGGEGTFVFGFTPLAYGFYKLGQKSSEQLGQVAVSSAEQLSQSSIFDSERSNDNGNNQPKEYSPRP